MLNLLFEGFSWKSLPRYASADQRVQKVAFAESSWRLLMIVPEHCCVSIPVKSVSVFITRTFGLGLDSVPSFLFQVIVS
jgi:hypothetical protein